MPDNAAEGRGQPKWTPGPWSAGRAKNGRLYVFGPDEWPVCGGFSSRDRDERGGKGTAEANAAHIVKCVNTHDALVESLEECLAIVRLHCGNLYDDTNLIQDKARAALAAGRGT